MATMKLPFYISASMLNCLSVTINTISSKMHCLGRW